MVRKFAHAARAESAGFRPCLRHEPLPRIENQNAGLARQHSGFIESARALTRSNDPAGFLRSLAKMARCASQFDYANLDSIIDALRNTNALEEPPRSFGS